MSFEEGTNSKQGNKSTPSQRIAVGKEASRRSFLSDKFKFYKCPHLTEWRAIFDDSLQITPRPYNTPLHGEGSGFDCCRRLRSHFNSGNKLSGFTLSRFFFIFTFSVFIFARPSFPRRRFVGSATGLLLTDVALDFVHKSCRRGTFWIVVSKRKVESF